MNKYELKKIIDLKPYKKNPRVHSEQQVMQIADSIKRFGFTVPILIDEDNNIIAGHGRLEASKLIELEQVPTIEIKNLKEEEKKALIIADNQLTLNSNWNEEFLKDELNTLKDLNFDLDLLGFTLEEIDGYLKDITEIPEIDDFNEVGEDITIEHICPKCNYKWSGSAS